MSRLRARAVACLVLIGAAFSTAPPARAQAVLQRTPNLDDGWIVRPGVVQFNFLHRFTVSDPPARKVTSFPTFVLATGLPADLALGVRYATNSSVFEGVPNEWEGWLRRPLLRQAGGGAADLALTVAYNEAARSGDGELSLARSFGRLRLLGAVRGMTSGYDTDRALWGAGAGAIVQVTRWLSIAADAFTILSEEEADEEFEPAWGVGAQLAIPYTPHTFSIQVVNTNTASIQGSSRGLEDEVTVGFEFTIPITLSRYFGGRAPASPGPEDPRGAAPPEEGAPEGVAQPPPPAAASADSALVEIRNVAFANPDLRVPAGTRVRWINRDAFEHTVTSDAGAFASGFISPGASYERVFDRPGTYPYHCEPHPFMRARVVVE